MLSKCVSNSAEAETMHMVLKRGRNQEASFLHSSGPRMINWLYEGEPQTQDHLLKPRPLPHSADLLVLSHLQSATALAVKSTPKCDPGRRQTSKGQGPGK